MVSYESQRTRFLNLFDEIEEFHSERPYDQVARITVENLLNELSSTGFAKVRKLRRIRKRLNKKVTTAIDEQNLRSNRNSISRRRMHRITRRFIDNFLTPYIGQMNERIDDAAQFRINAKTAEAFALATQITSFQ